MPKAFGKFRPVPKTATHILCLESAWRGTEQRRAHALYQRALPTSVHIQQQHFINTASAQQTLQHHFNAQRTLPVLILSSHSFPPPENTPLQQLSIQSETDSCAVLPLLQVWQQQLRHSLIILDSCYLGAYAQPLQHTLNALAIFGFQTQVDWSASSVAVMLLLRHLVKTQSLTSPPIILQRSLQRFQQQYLAQPNDFWQNLGANLALRAS